ncbi:Putative mycofactocin radical SAM maturase MftC [Candidatus Calditenuaceae archaeon HR02]|nr:Putative mycofactocin radical SAM maturase MftC [Candidatus Calditenuaceae archaeon HR02]
MGSDSELLSTPRTPLLNERVRGWLERFRSSPLLVFWETTKACPLSCRHCRAMAIPKPLPGELTTEEGYKLIEDVASFGDPKPLLVLTGGDPLQRPDLFELISKANELGVPTAISPAVSQNLTPDVMMRLKKLDIRMISVSLDGAGSWTHDHMRQVAGSFEATVKAIREALSVGLRVQVNTVVWRKNLLELPKIAALLKGLGVTVWEVFFLIVTGRAVADLDISPWEYEVVMRFLLEVSRRGLQVRTIEAPFFRRVKDGVWAPPNGEAQNLYGELVRDLDELMGPPTGDPDRSFIPTRDGNGVIFVAYNGDVYPSGFLPITLGNVRRRSLVEIYTENPLLIAMRNGEFKGRCGVCEYRLICGGSRARAFAATGDPLETDPACPYIPGRRGGIS